MINIAIDGPAGAGKSTVSKRLAAHLGYIYVDTGALYRAIGLAVIESGRSADDIDAVMAALGGCKVELKYVDGTQRVLLCGRDVSDSIRTPEVSAAASKVSAVPAVRQFLFKLQQDMAANNNVVMDGRDIGSVVLPNADIKIYLTASAEDRANRRMLEMHEKGIQADYDSVLADINARDYADSHREISPLIQAPDATLIDTSGYTLEQAVERLVSFCEERINNVG